MYWLNYHHLLYFYTVAREGSIARASKVLRLAQPTLSGQIHKLEHSLDEKLFERRGRNLVLTEMGRIAFRYAEEIFSLGGELVDTLRGRATTRPARLHVGIADAIPKLVVHRLLAASRLIEQGVQLVLRDGKTHELLAALAVQGFDLVVADTPLSSQVKVRAFNHLLGESPVAIFGTPELAKRHRRGFPGSLDGAPLILPADNSALRRPLEQWFDAIGVRPRVVAEIEDSALSEVFGRQGAGLFAAPSVVARDLKRQYGVHSLGPAPGVVERFYAITVERRITHPGSAAIAAAARDGLFS
jgi:LysR family transcriptional regulator, transcriptional activator of nhaA